MEFRRSILFFCLLFGKFRTDTIYNYQHWLKQLSNDFQNVFPFVFKCEWMMPLFLNCRMTPWSAVSNQSKLHAMKRNNKARGLMICDEY